MGVIFWNLRETVFVVDFVTRFLPTILLCAGVRMAAQTPVSFDAASIRPHIAGNNSSRVIAITACA
jgi:hypothetical protein